MTPLVIYLIFAIATSIVAMYELFIPVVFYRLEENSNVMQHKTIMLITFVLLGVLFAPFLLPSCILVSKGERFKDALERSLRDQ